MYRLPDGKPRAAVLLSIGASPTGLSDATTVNLGKALARAGFVTMLHWPPDLGARRPTCSGTTRRSWCARSSSSRAQDYVDPERTGIGGFSVGGSFAMVAAADPANPR